MPKVPKARLVINKDASFTMEKIPFKLEKGVILTKKNKKIGVLRFLANRSKKKKFKTQREKDLKMKLPFKHFKPKGGGYRFKRLETLVKNKHSQMKHWSIKKERLSNTNVYRNKLRKQLSTVSILIIVRVHRKKNIPRRLLSILHSLRLLRPFDCIVSRNTLELQHKLLKVLPFITFGVPTEQLIRDLVMKRGKLVYNLKKNKKKNTNTNTNTKRNTNRKTNAKSRHKHQKNNRGTHYNRSVIKSNLMIEQVFGADFELICIEDVIDVLCSNPYPSAHPFGDGDGDGDHQSDEDGDDDDAMKVLSDGRRVSRVAIFDNVTHLMNPFALNRISIPIKGLSAPFDHKGYWGFRGEYINTFIEKIL